MFGLDLQMGRELDASSLCSCGWLCSQILERWILSQPGVNAFPNICLVEDVRALCQEWVLLVRDEISGRQP
jgi:hypothetical protein